jgi:hypothetical protein
MTRKQMKALFRCFSIYVKDLPGGSKYNDWDLLPMFKACPAHKVALPTIVKVWEISTSLWTSKQKPCESILNILIERNIRVKGT